MAAPEHAGNMLLLVASLLDLAGAKAVGIQKRDEVKDYLDIHAILRHGIDVPALPMEVRAVLSRAAGNMDVTQLP